MRKLLMAALAAVALTVLVAAPASAGLPDGAVLPDDDGQCPAGFTLAYSGVCLEDVERDFGDGDGGARTTAAGALPRTGSDSLPLAKIGVVLLTVGALAVLAARKRADVVRS